jgi:hypothetical protein
VIGGVSEEAILAIEILARGVPKEMGDELRRVAEWLRHGARAESANDLWADLYGSNDYESAWDRYRGMLSGSDSGNLPNDDESQRRRREALDKWNQSRTEMTEAFRRSRKKEK